MNQSFRIRTFFSKSSLASILVASGVMAACSATPPAAKEAKEQTAATLAAVPVSFPIEGLFPTGLNGVGAFDSNYFVSADDPSCTGSAIGVDPSQVTAAWIDNIWPSSTWISCTPNAVGLPGTDYTYTTLFIVPFGIGLFTVTMSGLWACDDYCSILVNGQDTGIVSQNPNYGTVAPVPIVPAPTVFQIMPGQATFYEGPNIIQFVVHNVSGNQGLQIVELAGEVIPIPAPQPGCTGDSDCEAGYFCNTETADCEPQLPNGDPIPTIPGHDPDIDGICTPEVGAIVCASGVCDITDNLCGLNDGSGTCTDDAQCRLGNCDLASGLCGPSLPCCGNTYGANVGNQCVICDDAGVPIDSGTDASTDAAADAGDAGSSVNGADNTVQDSQGSGDNNPAGSAGHGASASGGGCQMGSGTSNASFTMVAGFLAMTVAAAARRRQKAVRPSSAQAHLLA
jgi:hypothetical protein